MSLTEVINGYKRFGFPNCWGKTEGRHISIIALSEYHVDYMNRKGWYYVIMQGDPFHRRDVYIGYFLTCRCFDYFLRRYLLMHKQLILVHL